MDKGLLLDIISVVASITTLLVSILRWGLLFYIISSWIPGLRESSIGEMAGKIYEPMLEPLRRIIPPLGGMLDLSPIILFFVLHFFVMGLNAIFSSLVTFVVQF